MEGRGRAALGGGPPPNPAEPREAGDAGRASCCSRPATRIRFVELQRRARVNRLVSVLVRQPCCSLSCCPSLLDLSPTLGQNYGHHGTTTALQPGLRQRDGEGT